MQQADTHTGGAAPQHAPGTRLREYETIFLVRPDLADDLVDKIVDRMRGIVHRDGGKVIKVENWGKKKVAYEVKKHLRAIFVRFLYLGNTHMVAEFERNLRMTDDVLKYQSLKISENVDPGARQVEADVKLPGDPEVPERIAREAEPFGDDRGFGRERPDVDSDVGPEAEPE
jgi:small subunit ribosomal protein S6